MLPFFVIPKTATTVDMTLFSHDTPSCVATGATGATGILKNLFIYINDFKWCYITKKFLKDFLKKGVAPVAPVANYDGKVAGTVDMTGF